MFTGRSYGGRSVTSAASIRMRPVVGTVSPASMRSKVVLPQPEPPSSENSSPRSIDSVTSRTAAMPAKLLPMFSRRICGVAPGAPRAAAPGNASPVVRNPVVRNPVVRNRPP